VLDLAKTESGRVELSRHPIDLRDLLDDIAASFKAQCESAGLTLIAPATGRAIPMEADDSRLRQVFSNLLSNAVRFTQRGGCISISLDMDEEAATVSVRDTGIGMAPEDVQTALTPFAQVDGRLARRYDGAGLGLPLAKALTELHGGTLSIASELGRGTSVTVRLPRDVAAGRHADVA
jgi:signal transduction histidine kinase